MNAVAQPISPVVAFYTSHPSTACKSLDMILRPSSMLEAPPCNPGK